MRIAVSVDGDEGLDSVVAQHFGRCPFFVIVDADDGKVQGSQVVENPFYARHQPGQVPQIQPTFDGYVCPSAFRCVFNSWTSPKKSS